jgi:hypothetical protein
MTEPVSVYETIQHEVYRVPIESESAVERLTITLEHRR